MSELIKPTEKQKQDGIVDLTSSEEANFLVMRGDYTAADIIQAAVHQDIIGAESAEDWALARFYQCWFKTTPGSGSYSSWNHPRDTPCRGAYFASVLCWN